ncbi:5789_t:CDS:2, partial [Paraglomus occultum]
DEEFDIRNEGVEEGMRRWQISQPCVEVEEVWNVDRWPLLQTTVRSQMTLSTEAFIMVDNAILERSDQKAASESISSGTAHIQSQISH